MALRFMARPPRPKKPKNLCQYPGCDKAIEHPETERCTLCTLYGWDDPAPSPVYIATIVLVVILGVALAVSEWQRTHHSTIRSEYAQ